MNQNDRSPGEGVPPHVLTFLPACLPHWVASNVATESLYSWPSVTPLKKESRFLSCVALQGEAGELDLVNLDIVPMNLSFVLISLHVDCARGGV